MFEPVRVALPIACAMTLALAAQGTAAAGMVVGNGVVMKCSQPDALNVRCNYRLTVGGQPLAVRASIGKLELPAPSFAARTGDPERVAVLLLVDTSDPGRAAAIAKVSRHVGRILDAAEPHQRFGLASFDSELRLLAPIGSSAEEIRKAAASLEASGRTTELYRNVVEALRLLARAAAPYKVLVVMSDGLAEDQAYFHADAVAEALRYGIAIYGIGYPRSVSLSVALQSLRRLAEETGGRYVAASAGDLALPEGWFATPFRAMENAGAVSVNLGTARDALPGGTQQLEITLVTSAGEVGATIPIELPARAPSEPVVRVVEVPRVVEVEKVVQVPVAAPAAAPTAQPVGVPLWYWVGAIGVLALALLALLLVLMMQRHQGILPRVRRRRAPAPEAPAPPVAQPTTAPEPAPESLARLTLLHAEGEPPATISEGVFRIGRLADNDLVLQDPSVSRHHAEIRRALDGRFTVLDLGSMNGILVNGKKLRVGPLASGDTLEVGDVTMTFPVDQTSDAAGEETVLKKGLRDDASRAGAGPAGNGSGVNNTAGTGNGLAAG